jgi:hypothetical protein
MRITRPARKWRFSQKCVRPGPKLQFNDFFNEIGPKQKF